MRLLFIVNHPSQSASSRYRVYQYLPHLEAAGFTCDVRPFTSEQLYTLLGERGRIPLKTTYTALRLIRRTSDILSARWFDVTILHREALPFGPPAAEIALAKFARRLVFDFDDAIHIPYPYASARPHPLLYGIKYGRGVDRVLGHCDAVFAGNEYLATYARLHNPRTYVIPTVVDTDHFVPVFRPKREPLTLGWIGSDSTADYLDQLAEPLRRLELRYPGRIRLKVVGATKTVVMPIPVEQKPWRLGDELVDLASFDVGIMPLQDDDWSRGKCALKAIQYYATGLPVVSSAIGPVVELVSEAQIPYALATSPAEWEENLERLLCDPRLREDAGMRGRRVVEARFSLKATTPLVIQHLRQLQG